MLKRVHHRGQSGRSDRVHRSDKTVAQDFDHEHKSSWTSRCLAFVQIHPIISLLSFVVSVWVLFTVTMVFWRSVPNWGNPHRKVHRDFMHEIAHDSDNNAFGDGHSIVAVANGNSPQRQIEITDSNDKRKALSPKQRVASAKKILLTYGENCCEKAKKRMCATASDKGDIDECFAYDATVMDAEFRSKHKHILTQRRGAGYWLWKPYIIYKHLTDPSLAEGSYISYSDAGAKVVGPTAHALEFMEENDDFYKGVLFFGVGMTQKDFCKRDAFVLQNCDNDFCHNAMQINAFAAFFRKCDYSRTVVKTWLDACTDERILTDKGNTQGKPNLAGFKVHRHDQAVITNVMNANAWNYDTTNGPVLDKVFHHDRFKS